MNEHIDRVTGEVTEAMPQRAADGQIVPQTALTGGAFLDLLEDGNFGREVHEQFRELAASMTDITNATGQKTKGKVVVTIDLSKDGEAFTVQGKVKVTQPEQPRPKSVMWTDEQHNFCRFPPQQMQMYGARPVRNVG